MRPAHFSFVSELMLILLFYVCLPHLFVFMVHSLEVSPFPCYPNDADCEASVPYHREAHQQLFEVWLKQSDDSEKQSYVYVDEQPDGYVQISHSYNMYERERERERVIPCVSFHIGC